MTFWIFALLFGFTWLITAPLTTTLAGRLYGFTHIGVIGGFITTIHHVGGGLWAFLGGVVYDLTGGYELAFIISAVVSAIAAACSLAIRETRHYAPLR
ncbi:MAG: MFS transporter [Actinobacteria bacterium]|nr:MFS transporter [Actinomycetota bacterium]